MMNLKFKAITYKFGDIIITCEEIDEGGRVIGKQLLLMNDEDLKFFKEEYYYDRMSDLIGKHFLCERGIVRGESVIRICGNVNIILLDGGYEKVHNVIAGDPAKLSQDDIDEIMGRC